MTNIEFTFDGDTFSFDPDHPLLAEATVIEKHIGEPYIQFTKMLAEGYTAAYQAFALTAVKRKRPETKFADLDGWDLGLLIDALDVGLEAAASAAEQAAEAEAQVPTPAADQAADSPTSD
ncbi:hypothetical protein [Cellulomonas sp. HZM]|uniref:hypothetical protein n=1 Tax=Cellulomonas sp. HZM TaxID=1454010 RepID=UPI000493560C|nr:hypothetical protein [Cellulomonas sp. HZM]